ncbi:MAG: hypothetical protein R6U95_07915 [Bacteroidales bacterium]
MRLVVLCVLSVFLTVLGSYAQEIDTLPFVKIENRMNVLFTEISQNKSPERNEELHAELCTVFDSVLAVPESYEYSFNALKCAQATSPDNFFRIFSWFVLQEAGVYKVKAYVQINPEYMCDTMVYAMQNTIEQLPDSIEHMKKDIHDWFPACYYDIIVVEKNDAKIYTLLGWSPFSPLSQYKVIEAVRISNCVPTFGVPTFLNGEQDTVSRIVFNYSAKSSMLMKYQKKWRSEQIVFDHLSPSSSEYTDIPEFYGPDGTYNSYEYDDEMWTFRENIDITNKGSRFRDFFENLFKSSDSEVYSDKDELY